MEEIFRVCIILIGILLIKIVNVTINNAMKLQIFGSDAMWVMPLDRRESLRPPRSHRR